MYQNDAIALVSSVYLSLFVYLLISYVWILLAGILASKKGRSVGGWIFGSMCLGLVAVIILAFLPDIRYEITLPRPAPQAKTAPTGSNAIGVARPLPRYPNEGWYCNCGARNDGNRTFCMTCMAKRPLPTKK